MPALHEIQQAVVRSLIERDDGEAIVHIRGEGVAAADRPSIYRNPPFGTLPDALRPSYPGVPVLFGADFS